MKKVMIAFAAMLISLSANAQSILGDSISLTARVGYSLGGTAPVGLPRTIRHMNSYTLMPNAVFRRSWASCWDFVWRIKACGLTLV